MSYTITITGDGASAGSLTTITVDNTGAGPLITELRVRPADGTSLSPHQLPAVNLRALIVATTTTDAVTTAETPAEPTTPAPRRTPPAKTAARQATTARNGRRRGQPEPVAITDSGARAYRRMPDPELLAATYRKTPSATTLAQHFDVPRHTINGWLRRLRTLGLITS